MSGFLWTTQHYNPEYRLQESEIFFLYLGREGIKILNLKIKKNKYSSTGVIISVFHRVFVIHYILYE
jgi:hypothetical protein